MPKSRGLAVFCHRCTRASECPALVNLVSMLTLHPSECPGQSSLVSMLNQARLKDEVSIDSTNKYQHPRKSYLSINGKNRWKMKQAARSPAQGILAAVDGVEQALGHQGLGRVLGELDHKHAGLGTDVAAVGWATAIRGRNLHGVWWHVPCGSPRAAGARRGNALLVARELDEHTALFRCEGLEGVPEVLDVRIRLGQADLVVGVAAQEAEINVRQPAHAQLEVLPGEDGERLERHNGGQPPSHGSHAAGSGQLVHTVLTEEGHVARQCGPGDRLSGVTTAENDVTPVSGPDRERELKAGNSLSKGALTVDGAQGPQQIRRALVGVGQVVHRQRNAQQGLPEERQHVQRERDVSAQRNAQQKAEKLEVHLASGRQRAGSKDIAALVEAQGGAAALAQNPEGRTAQVLAHHQQELAEGATGALDGLAGEPHHKRERGVAAAGQRHAQQRGVDGRELLHRADKMRGGRVGRGADCLQRIERDLRASVRAALCALIQESIEPVDLGIIEQMPTCGGHQRGDRARRLGVMQIAQRKCTEESTVQHAKDCAAQTKCPERQANQQAVRGPHRINLAQEVLLR
eukprot:m.160800 g.160800  ORF g.160800 m.160800 type:complete len:576 (+) comp9853_c0_seq1:1308-3035(+)